MLEFRCPDNHKDIQVSWVRTWLVAEPTVHCQQVITGQYLFIIPCHIFYLFVIKHLLSFPSLLISNTGLFKVQLLNVQSLNVWSSHCRCFSSFSGTNFLSKSLIRSPPFPPLSQPSSSDITSNETKFQ